MSAPQQNHTSAPTAERERARASLREWQVLRHELAVLESTRATVLLVATCVILGLFVMVVRELDSAFRSLMFLLLRVPILITMLSAAAYRRRMMRVRAYMRVVLEPAIPGINLETGLAHFDTLGMAGPNPHPPGRWDLLHDPGRVLSGVLGPSSGYQLAEFSLFVALSALASGACLQDSFLDSLQVIPMQQPELLSPVMWNGIAIGTWVVLSVSAVRLHRDTMRGGAYDRRCDEVWNEVKRSKLNEQPSDLH